MLGQFIEAQGGKNAWDASPQGGGASSAPQGAAAAQHSAGHPPPASTSPSGAVQAPAGTAGAAQENPPEKTSVSNFAESGEYMAGPGPEADSAPAYSSYEPYAPAGEEGGEDAGPDSAGEMGQPLPDDSGGYGPYATYAAYAPSGGEGGGGGLAGGDSGGYSPYSPYEVDGGDSGGSAELGTEAAAGAAPAADGGAGKKPGAGAPRKLTKKGADSNEWLRRLQERPCTSESEAREASMALGKVAQSFVNTAINVTTVLSSERGVPEEERVIQPLDVGGVAGGSKYLAYNIFFKVPVDEHGIYGHSHWALKAASTRAATPPPCAAAAAAATSLRPRPCQCTNFEAPTISSPVATQSLASRSWPPSPPSACASCAPAFSPSAGAPFATVRPASPSLRAAQQPLHGAAGRGQTAEGLTRGRAGRHGGRDEDHVRHRGRAPRGDTGVAQARQRAHESETARGGGREQDRRVPLCSGRGGPHGQGGRPLL